MLKSCKTKFVINIFSILLLLSISCLCYPGKADVVQVKVKKTAANTYHFSVTVKHDDQGWNHYADRWEVLDKRGKVVAVRVLLHPHVNEQPFTRYLTNVKIPGGIKEVIIRAHDKKHGYGGKEIKVKLPEKSK